MIPAKYKIGDRVRGAQGTGISSRTGGVVTAVKLFEAPIGKCFWYTVQWPAGVDVHTGMDLELVTDGLRELQKVYEDEV